MSSKLLSIILTANKFLGTAPPLGQKRLIKKIYSLIVVVVLTSGILVSSVSRSYLKKYTHMKFIISVLSDIIAYAFNCYTIFFITFTKERQWKNLIKTIKIKEAENDKTCPYVAFLLLNIIFWIIVLCSNYAFTQIVVFKSVPDLIILNIEMYTQFLFGCLIYVILKMLLSRYCYLNYLLSDYVHNMMRTKSISSDDFIYFVKRIEHVGYSLKESVDHFNEIFGIPLLLMVSYCTLHFVNYIDDFFFFRFDSDKFNQFLISNICLVTMNFVGNCFLIIKCDAVLKEAANVKSFAYKLRKCFPCVLSKERIELNEFIDFAVNNFPKFSAGGFFAIQKSTIFSVLSTITTLLIVMIQFDATKT
ncbi:7tm 7 domain containing protein [Asbolus verrucosus]|uniref:Gustatory receptor n=1 Tax=Asbolus verrucosus TaxID=1661398 RepID=A0A482W520_ASBVE|nr:7tm 7 domain containing protein [Asbolus verrucosus]